MPHRLTQKANKDNRYFNAYAQSTAPPPLSASTILAAKSESGSRFGYRPWKNSFATSILGKAPASDTFFQLSIVDSRYPELTGI